PPLHVTPHPPQFVASFWVSTHVPLHWTVPPPQERVHCPLTQISPLVLLHTLPHVPQLELSLSRLAHAALHRLNPEGHGALIDVPGRSMPASISTPPLLHA